MFNHAWYVGIEGQQICNYWWIQIWALMINNLVNYIEKPVSKPTNLGLPIKFRCIIVLFWMVRQDLYLDASVVGDKKLQENTVSPIGSILF